VGKGVPVCRNHTSRRQLLGARRIETTDATSHPMKMPTAQPNERAKKSASNSYLSKPAMAMTTPAERSSEEIENWAAQLPNYKISQLPI